VKYYPRKEQKQEQKQDKEVVLKIQPVTPPQPLVKDKEDEEFEKQLEALKRQFKLLEYKLKIEKLKAEMEKLRGLSLVQLNNPQPQREKEKDRESEELKEKLFQIQLKRQQDRLLSYKLAYLQNLFTGVMEINGRKIAFDGQGRKYTPGSSVEGFQIVKIDDDGVVVVSPYGGTYKVPISSSISEGKNSDQTPSAFQPPQPLVPPEQPPETLPYQ